VQTWLTARNPRYAVEIEVVSKPAVLRAPIGACTAADTSRHGNTPWGVQIADLNVSIFAHFSDRRSESFLSKILDQIGDLNMSPCLTKFG